MNKKNITYTLDDLPEVVTFLYQLLNRYPVMTLVGPLGAGKTTLAQALMRHAGVQEVIQSPTFTYMSTYTTPSGWRFYHFDLYRLGTQREFMDAGFNEYLFEPISYALIEWPEIIMPLLRHKVMHVSIEYATQDQRILHYECVE